MASLWYNPYAFTVPREYPPAALTGTSSTNVTGQAYGNGTYTYTTSSAASTGTALNYIWDKTTSKYVSTATSGTVTITINLPVAIKLYKYTLDSGSLVSQTVAVYASADNVNYSLINGHTGIQIENTLTSVSTTKYTSFRIILTLSGTAADIREIKFFGLE